MRLSLTLLLLLTANSTLLFADAGTHDVHSVFVAPPKGGKPDALGQRVTAKLRQSGGVQVVNDERQADAVLHIDGVFWPIGSMTLNPRSQSGGFTNYQGYASVDLDAPSGQVLWSYLATPKRFKMTGIVDNLADQISERLVATLKSGIAAATAGTATSSVKGAALHAAGATFPAPLYLKWFQSFAEVPGGVAIRYDAVGSVKGLEALKAGKVELAASDIPPVDSSTAANFDANILRLPSVAGGIVAIYNVAGARDEIDLTGDVLADIYAGKVTHWNDPRIRALNRNTRLPDATIAVIHRSDGSGTSFVWTSYLALANPEWKSRVGASVDWPVGVGMAGNEGVADAVEKTPNSIGYVEMTFAIQHHLTYADVRNPAGRMIKASLDSITAAAQSSRSNGANIGGPILNSPDKDAYPIATFTWLAFPGSNGPGSSGPGSSADAQKRTSIKRFLQWMLVDGQRECSALGYAPLPRDLVKEEQRVVDGLK